MLEASRDVGLRGEVQDSINLETVDTALYVSPTADVSVEEVEVLEALKPPEIVEGSRIVKLIVYDDVVGVFISQGQVSRYPRGA